LQTCSSGASSNGWVTLLQLLRYQVTAQGGQGRRAYVEIDGIVQPPPAPRFSRTVPDLPIPPQPPSSLDEAEAVLAPWLDPAEIAALRAAGTVGSGSAADAQ
jgi:hypothetical protein